MSLHLTDVKVRTVTLPDGKKQMKLFDGGGLYLLVNPSGKYWRLNYRFAGKQKTLALGIYPRLSLTEAREAKEREKTLLRCESPIDPNQRKKQKRKADKLSELDVQDKCYDIFSEIEPALKAAIARHMSQ